MSEEMGKNLDHQESQITLKNHNPGCMWGILHHFQQNRWNHVVKRLPRKRLIASAKHSTDQERVRSSSDGAKVQGNNKHSVPKLTVERKATVPSPPSHKSSMKSRLKALITDEMYRKKGRHRRSSTYPSRKPLDKVTPLQNQEASSPTASPSGSKSNENLSEHTLPSSDDPSLPKFYEESSSDATTPCEMCDTMLKVNYLKQNEVSKLGKESVRDHTVLHGDSIYAVERSERDSIQESKIFMDALDLLNVRQEVFMKILQDPSSSLARQLHFRRTPKVQLTKSVSSPALQKKDLDLGVEEKRDENGNLQQFSDDMMTKKNENRVVLKGFKNIREKLKHVIRDKKKEKNRIIKDALNDKIPCDRDVSKKECQIVCDFGKRTTKPLNRTASFNDSFARYNQLLEISVDREKRDQVSDKLRVAPIRKSSAILSRILSLPDLRPYSSSHTDDSRRNASFVTSETNVVNEQKVDLGCKSESCRSEGGVQENMLGIEEVFDELGDSKTLENTSSCFDFDFEADLSVDCHPLKLGEIHEHDETGQKIEVPVLEDTKIEQDYPNFEPRIIPFFNELLQVEVDTKNEAEFNYVKDILELSGFSRDEILGQWHSPDLPLDPLMFEEIEGECEEAYTNNGHLLMFDIINEVLLGIYERSICYWPSTLTSSSRIHHLPKGNRVLEEVWAEIRWLLSWTPEVDQAIDDAVVRDLARRDGWMNLQMDAECVGIELEDVIFDDLLDEIIAT